MRPAYRRRGAYYFITRRCTQRKFLLLSGKLADALVTYALANAAKRTHMQILGFCVMSNHYHLVCYDPHGNVSKFAHHFNMFVARSCNAAFGRAENFWASDGICIVELVTRQDVVDKLAYTLANPVAAGLVGRASAWFGVSSWRAMLQDTAVETARPRVFYRKTAPALASLRITVPPGLGPRATFVADVVNAVRAIEHRCDATRQQHKTQVLGRAKVLKQSRDAAPATRHTMFGLRPRVACRSQWARIATLQRNTAFERAHAAARQRLLRGEVANFPLGTVALRALIGPVREPNGPPLIDVFAASHDLN